MSRSVPRPLSYRTNLATHLSILDKNPPGAPGLEGVDPENASAASHPQNREGDDPAASGGEAPRGDPAGRTSHPVPGRVAPRDDDPADRTSLPVPERAAGLAVINPLKQSSQ
jgi:hypothetical protein